LNLNIAIMGFGTMSDCVIRSKLFDYLQLTSLTLIVRKEYSALFQNSGKFLNRIYTYTGGLGDAKSIELNENKNFEHLKQFISVLDKNQYNIMCAQNVESFLAEYEAEKFSNFIVDMFDEVIGISSNLVKPTYSDSFHNHISISKNFTNNNAITVPFNNYEKLCEMYNFANNSLNIVIHPGYCYAGKRERFSWDEDDWANLILKLESSVNCNIIVVGSNPTDGIGRITKSGYDLRKEGIGTPLNILLSVISGCSLFIGVDSGSTHYAGSIGVPVIQLGNATPDSFEATYPITSFYECIKETIGIKLSIDLVYDTVMANLYHKSNVNASENNEVIIEDLPMDTNVEEFNNKLVSIFKI